MLIHESSRCPRPFQVPANFQVDDIDGLDDRTAAESGEDRLPPVKFIGHNVLRPARAQHVRCESAYLSNETISPARAWPRDLFGVTGRNGQAATLVRLSCGFYHLLPN